MQFLNYDLGDSIIGEVDVVAWLVVHHCNDVIVGKIQVAMEKAIQEKSDITQTQKETLGNDIKSAPQDAHKPDRSAIDKVVSDMLEFMSDGYLGYREIETLKDDINLLLNSANISDEEIEILKEDLQAIGESSNFSEEDLETLYKDTVQIVETAKKVNNL